MASMSDSLIDLYWRPKCPDCLHLRRQLDKLGISTVEHNIWEDPSASAFVRKVANGNETVPTVVICNFNLVNPTIDEVVAAIKAVDASLITDNLDRIPSRFDKLAVIQWTIIFTLIALSFFIEYLGQRSLSWATDGVNAIFWLVMRSYRLRHRSS